MATAEILAIGNELLLGEVQDTNTHYLCRQLTGLGGEVTRTAMLPDDPAVLVPEFRASLRREPDLILTTGGLGPTVDDLTLAAVAEAAGAPLGVDQEAFRLVATKYAELAAAGEVGSAAMNEARQKMARLPAGSVPLPNPVGAAPGVRLRVAGSTVVCLPGVPGELRGIFEHSLPPLLSTLFGSCIYLEEVVFVRSNDESHLAPVLRRLSEQHPDVYLKSRAKSFGGEVTMKVLVSARGDDGDRLRAKVAQVLRGLDDLVGIVRGA